MPSTPFSVAFTLKRSSGVGYVRIGTNTNNCILIGQVGNDGSNGIARMNSGSYSNLQLAPITPPVNTPIDVKGEFTGTVYRYTIGTETITVNDVGQSLSSLIIAYLTNGNTLSNLRVKPL
jgi:hypothetical protein